VTYSSINGQILPQKKAQIFIEDRGFRFGDGVFETCLIFEGKIYNWKAHFDRLEQGLAAIKINNAQIADLKENCLDLIVKNNAKNGYLRINISRGAGSIGYLPQKNIKPNITIETLPEKERPQGEVRLMISSYQKPSIKSLPVNFKISQGLNSTLAKMEALESGCFDAILLNENDHICETSSANIFWVKNDILYTPHQDCGCILGTVRDKILQLSPIKTQIVTAKTVDLLAADEVFVSNTSVLALAIDKIGDKKFTNQKYAQIFNRLLKDDIEKQTRN
jgi:aminodeoxychorismate lyase